MKRMIYLALGIVFFSFCFLSVTFADTSNIDINQIDIVEPYVHVSSQSYIDTYFSWYFAKINNYTTYAQFKINPDFLADTKNITAISTSNQVTTYCNKWLNLTNGSLALSNCDATSVTTLKSNVLNLTTVKNYPLINLTTNIGFSNFTYNASSGIGEFYISFPKGITGNESAKLGFGTVLVDSTASSGDYPCIALDSNGYVYIAHTAGTVVRQCNNTLGWACSQIDANGSIGYGIGCAMDNQNVFHIMYRDGGNNTWRYWNNSAVQIRYAMILGYAPAYASLAIDSLNNKHFVFDNYTGARQAVYCNATALTNTFSTCSKPDSTENAGEYIQVTVNSTNHAHVVFLRQTSGTLRYCNITSGSTWTCRSLGTGAGGYGTYPTISVRNDQSIVIVSVNITGTDSIRLWNNSVNARDTWKEYILAYGASIQYTSVAVDYANNTHVIWFNATNTMAYLNVTNGFTVKATARYAGTNTGGQCMGSCIAIKKGNEGNFSNSYDTTAHFAYRNSTLNYDNMTGLPSSAPPPAGTAWNGTASNALTLSDIISNKYTYQKKASDAISISDTIIVTSTSYNISSCTELSAAGHIYTLDNDIVNLSSEVCISITSGNITLDCKGHKIEGNASVGGIAIFSDVSKNITVKNCYITNWGSSGISGNYDYSNITNCTFNNTNYGIHLTGGTYNEVINNSFFSNKNYDIWIDNSGFNKVYFNIFQDAGFGASAIFIDYSGGADASLIFNNFFNKTYESYIQEAGTYSNNWNITQQTGTRIYSFGDKIGGNYYTTPANDGFSDTCIDANTDRFCDDAYAVGNYQTDYLPLTYERNTGNVSDAIIISDSITKNTTTGAVNYQRNTSDIISISESIVISKTMKRNAIDALALSDTIAVKKTISKSLMDVLALSDNITKTTVNTYSRNALDVMSLSDAITTRKNITKAISDAIPLYDNIKIGTTASRNIKDTIIISEIVSRTTVNSYSKNAEDAIVISDIISTKKTLIIKVSDALIISDNITKTSINQYSRSVSDALSLSGSISTYAFHTYSKSVLDSLILSDKITASSIASHSIVITDAISLLGIINAQALVKNNTRYVSDAILLSDNANLVTSALGNVIIILNKKATDAFVSFNWSTSGGTLPINYNATLYETSNLSRVVYSLITTSNTYKFIGLNGSTNYTVVVNATDSGGKSSQLNMTAMSEVIVVSWEIAISLGLIGVAIAMSIMTVFTKAFWMRTLFLFGALMTIVSSGNFFLQVATAEGQTVVGTALVGFYQMTVVFAIVMLSLFVINFVWDIMDNFGKLPKWAKKVGEKPKLEE